eukprot:3729275-Amphidinium_carterae.1
MADGSLQNRTSWVKKHYKIPVKLTILQNVVLSHLGLGWRPTTEDVGSTRVLPGRPLRSRTLRP